jgi:hypothetical protein
MTPAEGRRCHHRRPVAISAGAKERVWRLANGLLKERRSEFRDRWSLGEEPIQLT